MRRAVLGGSFNPVHRGHVAMAKAVLESWLADCVHVVPAWQSPFKNEPSAPVSDRLAMVRLAFAGMDSVFVESLELEKQKVSYTVETLTDLARKHPDDALSLIIGADNLDGLPRWKKAGRIAELANLIVLGRNQQSMDLIALEKSGFPISRVFTLPDFDYPVSSSSVREHLLNGQFSSDDLPTTVMQYIRSHDLYVQP